MGIEVFHILLAIVVFSAVAAFVEMIGRRLL